MRYAQRGALLLEFVLILPFFLWLVFVGLYYAIVAHDVSALHDAVRTGSRAGAVLLVDNDDADSASAKLSSTQAAIKDYAEGVLYIYTLEESGARISVETDGVKVDDEDGVCVTLVAVLKDSSSIPVLVRSVVPDSISSTLTMRLEQ